MADDRWLTFDCYGTIADWNTCMRAALEPIAGQAAPALLAAYHQAELVLEAGPPWRPYRDVLTSGLRWAARRLQIPLAAAQADALTAAWPQMAVFQDAGGALTALASGGWRLAILTNCDDDLFATTRPKLPAGFDIAVTAEQVRSYKPDLGHFRKFAELTGATPANWIHVANSWVHDILPAARMGLRSVWVDRDLTGHPAKLAERRITAMRRLPETVADVSAVPPWPPLELPANASPAAGLGSCRQGRPWPGARTAVSEEDAMTGAELLADAFGRIRETVSDTVYGLTPEQLAYRIDKDANPIAWLVWHLTRVQDDHVAAAFGVPQVWSAGNWAAAFGLPAGSADTGYGHNRVQVAAIAEAVSAAAVLTDYHEATYRQTVKLVSGVTDADLDRVVDTSWRPPVTLGVRLVSVINDDAQHAGQAAFVRGVVLRSGRRAG